MDHSEAPQPIPPGTDLETASQPSRLPPGVEELVRKVDIDPATLGNRLEPNVQGALREFGIDPLHYEAFIETMKALIKKTREDYARAGRSWGAVRTEGNNELFQDGKHDWMLRRFGLDPEKIKAFYAALQVGPPKEETRDVSREAKHQPPSALKFTNPELPAEPVTASALLSCSSK